MKNPTTHAFQAKAKHDNVFLNRAKGVFRAVWAAQAFNTLSNEVAGVWAGVAHKPTSPAESKLLVNRHKMIGGCQCSAVRYEAYRLPKEIIVCHCFTCGRLFDSGNLPFMDVPTNLFRYTESRDSRR